MDMGEDVPPHVRLDEGAQPVAPVADDELQNGAQDIGTDQAAQEQHEGLHQGVVHSHGGDEGAQNVLGHQGERYVHGGDDQRTGEIQGEQALMGPIIG